MNSNGTVKIGDFGMTRPICETDYYRFTKKGNVSNDKAITGTAQPPGNNRDNWI